MLKRKNALNSIFYKRVCEILKIKSATEYVSAKHSATEFSFFPEDPWFNRFLERYMPNQIKGLEDIKDLTRAVYEGLSSKVGENYHSLENVPIGYEMVKRGIVCRHIAAVEYALLIIHGKEAYLVATPKEKVQELGESHCFLHVVVSRKYMVDPVNNLVMPLDSLEEKLGELGKPIIYHKGAQKVRYIPHYV